MSNAVTNAIVDYLAQHPAADNESVALHVRSAVPGSTTTAASVSSVKSRLRKEGHQFQQAPRALASFQPVLGPDGEPLPAHLQPVARPAFGAAALPDFDPTEPMEEAQARIANRYEAMGRMVKRLVDGKIPSLIVSGPPGLGKSFGVRGELAEKFPDGPDKEDLDDNGNVELHHDTVSGSISAVGLYQALYAVRNGGVLVLDDVDDVFRDETALNLLKGALDSQKVRIISWRKEARWLEDNGIPDRFEFKGHVVFLTNIDFEAEIMKGGKLAEHYKALVDRSLYLSLTMRTRRDFMIRIRQVAIDEGMLERDFDLTAEQAEEVMVFMADHQTRFYNLSLRLAGQIATCMIADGDNWQKDVEATKMRTL